MNTNKILKPTFWKVVSAIIVTVGLFSTYYRFSLGLGATTNLHDNVPWGLWIGFDFLGVGLAAAGFTIAATVHIFNIHKYESLVRPAILTAFLGYSLVASLLIVDLGRPENFWHPLVMWNIHSVMFEITWCLICYTTVLTLEFAPVILEKFNLKAPIKILKKISIPVVIAGVLFSTLHQSSFGSLYLIVPGRLHPLWYSPIIPIMFFINKLDRPGKDAFELLDEIEFKLHCKVTPLSWPIGMGIDFKGVYNKYDKKLDIFDRSSLVVNDEGASILLDSIDDPVLDDKLGESAHKFREEFKLVSGVFKEFSKKEYLHGDLSPVFFGSALNNFGVRDLLDCFTDIAPHPQPVATDTRDINPEYEKFTGFVFKIHANIDPNHRSRIAFVKVVSGMFERNKYYYHTKLKRTFKFSSPTSFMASKKEIIDLVY